jgi:predicted HAD superfamily phosphohydrolase
MDTESENLYTESSHRFSYIHELITSTSKKYHIVHIATIVSHPEGMLHIVIDLDQIEIREMLREEIAERESASLWCHEETLRMRKISPSSRISDDTIS